MKRLARRLHLPLAALSMILLLACSPSGKDAGEAQPVPSAKGFKAPPEKAGDPGAYLPIVEPVSPATVGFGLDLNNHQAIPNTCVDGTVEVVPRQEGYFSLDADYSRSELESALGVSASGGASFLFWGASARATFAHKARMTSHAINYVVFAYNKHHSKVFMPTGRKAAWQDAAPDEWLQSCGAGYVAAQDFGSMLIVKFSLLLEDRSAANAWGASASGRFLSFAKMRSAISGNNRTARKKGVLSVSAIQIGGKPEELGKILKTDSDKGVIESFALCNVEEVEKCLEGLRSVESYLANDFPAQIQDKEDGGGTVLTTYPFRYPKTIGPDSSPAVLRFVLEARKLLGVIYDEEMEDISRIRAYADEDDKEAQAIADQAIKNVADIRQATELCYSAATYEQCAASAERLRIEVAATVVPGHLGVGDSGQGNTGSNSDE